MKTLFVPIQRQPVPDSVSQQILALVRGRNLQAGDRLPSERELMESLGVGRSSVREALRGLVSLGLLEIRRGIGVFVADAGERVFSTIGLSLLPQENAHFQLMEARREIEVACAGLAAERARPENLRNMADSIELYRVSAERSDLDQMVLADLTFHDAVFAATQNPIFLQMLRPVNQLLLEGRRKTSRASDILEIVVNGHTAIMDAIASGDAARSRRAMADHIRDAVVSLTKVQEIHAVPA